jgi:tetratricopeptide (TPR) repeat protein
VLHQDISNRSEKIEIGCSSRRSTDNHLKFSQYSTPDKTMKKILATIGIATCLMSFVPMLTVQAQLNIPAPTKKLLRTLEVPTLSRDRKILVTDRAGSITVPDRIAQSNESLQTYLDRADAKVQMGDFKGAIAEFDRAIQLAPNNPKIYENRGYAKFDLNDYKDAIIDFDRAIQIDRSYTKAYCSRGDAKSRLKDYQGAIVDLDRATQLNPNYAGAYRNRGIAKSGLNDSQGAIVDYNRAIQINPKDHTAYSLRALEKISLNDMEGAISDIETARKLTRQEQKNNQGQPSKVESFAQFCQE